MGVTLISRATWHDVAALTLLPLRRPLILAALAFGGVLLWWVAAADEPAPLALHAGAIYAAVALLAAMAGHEGQYTPQAAGLRQFWAALLRTALLLVLVHGVARALGMPALPHPVSTTLALAATALFCAGLAAVWPLLPGSPSNESWVRIGLTLLLVLGMSFRNEDRGFITPFLALSPGHWAQAAIQTAVTGTGTRAAAATLLALAGVGGLALLAACLPTRRWPPWLLGAGWLGLAGLVWQQPAPRLPRADMGANYTVQALQQLSARDQSIAPIATSAPDAALASALTRVQRQIKTWPPAADPDPQQSARNLLLIAAVPDLYDTEPLQSHLPILVRSELRARIPAAQLPGILAAIAAHPEQGSVAARETLPKLGLPASTGDEAAVRKRVALYAAKLGDASP
jgi:hypothetical protein